MASREFQELMRAAANRPAPPADETLDELRQRVDSLMALIPIAVGVDVSESEWNGVRGLLCSPHATDSSCTVVYLHGGGFRLGSAIAYRAFASHVAAALSANVVVPDYRLAPENPFPAALDDACAVFDAIVDAGTAASQIIVAGDSAGGGLAASVVLSRMSTERVPAGLACFSPWADLELTSSTYDSRASSDRLFSRQAAETARSMYLGSSDPADPLASPVRGNWQGAPPSLILAGGVEVLLGDALTLGHHMALAGVEVELHVFSDMPHIWITSYPAFPEAIRALELFAHFARRVTSQH